MVVFVSDAPASVYAPSATSDWIWLLVLIQRAKISKREGLDGRGWCITDTTTISLKGKGLEEPSRGKDVGVELYRIVVVNVGLHSEGSSLYIALFEKVKTSFPHLALNSLYVTAYG
jgi:hypothetical protein